MESQTVQPEVEAEHDTKVSPSQDPHIESADCGSVTVKADCTEQSATLGVQSGGLVTDPLDPPSRARDSDGDIAVKQEPMEWADNEMSFGKREEDVTGGDVVSSSGGPAEAGDSVCKSNSSFGTQKASSHGTLRVRLQDVVKPNVNIKVEPLDLSANSVSQKPGMSKDSADTEEYDDDQENTSDSDIVNDKSPDCDGDSNDDDEDDTEMESLPIYFQSDSSTLHQNKDLQRLSMQVAKHVDGEENENPLPCSSGSDTKNNHICHICHEKFSGKMELCLHARTHPSTEELTTYIQELASQVLSQSKAKENGKNPVQCPHCEEMFASEYELGGHIKLHYRLQRRRCRHCSKVFKGAYECREHERKEHSDKELVKRVFRSQVVSEASDQPISVEQNPSTDSLKCKICLSVFASASELTAHRKTHNDKPKVQAVSKKGKETGRNKKTERGKRNQPRKCPQCGSEFKNAKNLRSHMRVHSKVKPYTCDECTAAFVRSSDLRRHKKTHTGEKGFKCQLCASAFADSSKLKIHMRIHTGERPYKCELCGEAFSQASQYSRHIRVHNGEKPFQCPYCPSAFTMTSDYRRHLKIHTGERPFMCEYCPASFPEAKNLRIHVRTHTGEKPYKCEFCNSAFAQTANLKRHIKTHTGERPAKCELCPSAFADKHKLRVHMRSHSGEKPYQCQTCPSAFATSSALNRHYIMHSGAKRYKCEHCPALFAHMSKLRVHAVCHSFNGPFKCQLCTASFKNAYGLTVHSHVHE